MRILLTAIIGWILGAWGDALIVAMDYLILKEGGQIVLAGGNFPDILVVATGARLNQGELLALALLVLAGIGGKCVAYKRDGKHREHP